MNTEQATCSNTTQHQATSLDRLHDVSIPPDISWWPPAPGWYGVLTILGVGLCVLSWRWFVKFRSNAYRRIALRELNTLHDPASIAELLRRTALAIVPRQSISKLTGTQWLDWLSSHCPEPMPESVKSQLTDGTYRKTVIPTETDDLRQYAAQWITQHQI